MRRRWKLILFAIVLPLVVIGGCGVAIAYKMRPKPEKPRTAKVARGDVEVTVRETGRVEPIKRVDVKSKVAGQLVLLAVDEGDQVEKGQLIARLDVPELEAQRDQIRAQLDAARARLNQARMSHSLDGELTESQLKQAESNLRVAQSSALEAGTRHRDAQRVYETKRRLFESGGYVSQNDVDSAKATFDLAAQGVESAKERVQEQQAAVAIAEARRVECDMSESRVTEAEASVRQIQDLLTEIEARLRDAVIRAPCSGTVITRHIREGEMISAVTGYGDGAPLVTIGDLSTMLVKVDLNEVDVHDVSLGQQVEITVDALRDQSYEGEVTRISPASVSPAGGWQQGQTNIVRFPIDITVNSPSDALMPGMTANAEIQSEAARDVLWVPNDAIFEKEDEKGKSFVSVVTGEKKKGKSFLPAAKGEKKGEPVTEDREVTLGLANNSRTEIKSGLEEGEEIQLGKAAIPERKIIDISMDSKNQDEKE